MDKGFIFTRRRRHTFIIADHRLEHKYPASYYGSGHGYTAEDVDKDHGQRSYRRAETAAEDDAHNNAYNVWVHILQYAFRLSLILGN